MRQNNSGLILFIFTVTQLFVITLVWGTELATPWLFVFPVVTILYGLVGWLSKYFGRINADN